MKLNDVYYRSVAYLENMKHCYTAIGLLNLSNQEEITAKFAVQVCGSKKSFAVAEVQKITANLRLRTNHCYFEEFAVAK